ncbi:MAG: alpha-amylase family glycosyl hydrolase [Bacteroidales bacterium]|jgi:maltose alpha-D-glucosyltransferase/alpha-amylase|nr:alpha-amylase family glycosyl hydrolase [Bacteroidales bacterium]
MNPEQLLYTYWKKLYPNEPVDKLTDFLESMKNAYAMHPPEAESDWYKDAVVYSLYVDLFNKDFNGLIDKLDYLQDLGVNCLWLLPILDSPMRDAGFDIRNYDRIRADLLGLEEGFSKSDQEIIFGRLLKEAHKRHLKVIFDVAINHCSDAHPWFAEARKSEDNPYRDYYIWSKNTDKYADARLLFKGIEDSNWESNGDDWYYFHRFFNFQPDLNYRNPEVLLEMSKNLLYWQKMGVDGFRADAIPYLWKEDGTSCENLLNTHTIVKFFRAMLDYVKPGTLLLAEACQKPNEVVKYLGEGDECHAAYHFPLMPMMFKAIAAQDGAAIKDTLNPAVTPEIPDNSQWFTFLRVHDELSLELVYVSEKDRKFIHDHYCLKPEWDFRVGEGISARLSELMQRDERKIALAYSLMLTLVGSPVVYYGDEFGKLNDEKYYTEQIKLTGKDDTRFLVRGRIDWNKLEVNLRDENSFHAQVYHTIKEMLNARKQYKVFGRGMTEFIETPDLLSNKSKSVLSYFRTHDDIRILVINNLSEKAVIIDHPLPDHDLALLYPKGFTMDEGSNSMHFDAFGFAWFLVL